MKQQLFEAIEKHDLNGLAEVLKQGADPNATQAEWPKFTALQAAINELEDGGPLDAVRLLLSFGAKVDRWDPDHAATPLLMAVFRGQRDAVRMLLSLGANPNVRGDEGDSPLRWCAEQGDLETAKLLLEHGAHKTIDDSGGACGCTALGRAAMGLNLPMIDLLLAAGADPEARDADGRTARQRLPAGEPGNERLVALALARLKRRAY